MRTKQPYDGFSLVEITLALGIASFTLIAILGLLPVGLNSTQTASEQSQAANIVSQIVADLQQTRITAEDQSVASTRYGIVIPELSPQDAYSESEINLLLDENGHKVTAVADARYQAIIKTRLLIPVSAPSGDDDDPSPAIEYPRGARIGTVEVFWPAGVTDIKNAQGRTHSFFALDRN